MTPYIEYAPAEIYDSLLRKALQDLGLPVTQGAIQLPTAPGVGFEIPDDLIAHFRLNL